MRQLYLFIAGPLISLLFLTFPASAVIFGETETDTNGFRPFTVMITITKRAFCTGIVISKDIVLTAAHCLASGGQPTVVSLTPKFRERRHSVLRGIAHPRFVRDLPLDRQAGPDIAVMRLTAPLPDDMSPISLANRYSMGVGQAYTMAGFGMSVEWSVASQRHLRRTTVHIISDIPGSDTLKIALGKPDKHGRGHSNACFGDSGGPVNNGHHNSRELTGIITMAVIPRGGNKKRPCSYMTAVTKLDKHWDWIVSTSKEIGGAPIHARIETKPTIPDANPIIMIP